MELEKESLLKEGVDIEKRVFTKVKLEENEESFIYFEKVFYLFIYLIKFFSEK